MVFTLCDDLMELIGQEVELIQKAEEHRQRMHITLELIKCQHWLQENYPNDELMHIIPYYRVTLIPYYMTIVDISKELKEFIKNSSDFANPENLLGDFVKIQQVVAGYYNIDTSDEDFFEGSDYSPTGDKDSDEE